MKILQFKLLSVFLIFALVSCKPPSTDDQSNERQPQEDEQVPSEEGNNEEENVEEEEMTAIEFAKYVAKNLKEKSFENWNEFTGEKVYFSPYAYVDTAQFVSLNKSKFNELFESEKKIIWGRFDGTGEEIKFSIQKYFNRFVTDFDLTAEENQLLKDTIPARGNELNNVKEIFSNSTVIEIHKPASEESMGMDWRSLMLVIEKIEGSWKLKALVHNEWTI